MVKIKITENVNMKFFDAITKKIQWYSTDMFKGNIMEFKDIDHSDSNNIFFVCLDDEFASLPIKSFIVISYNEIKQ